MRSLSPFAARVRRAVDARPRAPFVIAVALAAIVLLGAVDWNPVAADRLREVDEIAFAEVDDRRIYENVTVEVESLEVVEFGYSPVTGPDGEAMLAVGIHFANPHDDGYLWGSLAVTAVDGDGVAHRLAVLFAGIVPPAGEQRIGVLVPVGDVDPGVLERGALRVEPVDMTLRQLDGDDPLARFWYAGPEPEIAAVAAEDLHVPAGVRLEFRIESAAAEHLSLSAAVFFRDAEGRLVGGIAFDPTTRYASAVDNHDGANSVLPVPSGTSTRYLELRHDEIPADADLDRIEIGFNSL